MTETLSDKIKEINVIGEYLIPKHVKQFIKDLKEEKVDYTTSRKRWLKHILNKLAGDKLTK